MKKRVLILSVCFFLLIIICFIYLFLYFAKLESECEFYKFDENGNMIYMYAGKEKGGTKQYWEYNSNNQILETKVVFDTTVSNQLMTGKYVYDEDGLLIKEVYTTTVNDKVVRTNEKEYFYNGKKQLVKAVALDGTEWIYAYDDKGHKKSISSSSGGFYKYEYDDIKKEALMVEYSFGSTIVRWNYDDFGRLLKEYYDNKTHEWFYDEVNPEKLSKEISFDGQKTIEIIYKGSLIYTKCYKNYQTENEELIEQSIQKVKYTYWPNKKIKTQKIYTISRKRDK
ncbi:MAG: hypothetical protein ACTTIO_06395 [Candidatus Fimenecus sp.]